MRVDLHETGRRPRWGVRLTAVASIAVLGASGVGHGMVHGLNADVHRVDPFHGLANRPRDTGGVNFLVVGVDKRDELTSKQRRKYRLGGEACDCTDTLMLVHLAADHDRASIVSLPRDSFTEIPAHVDDKTGRHVPAKPAKLNAAYADGGAPLTVNTVESMTGVHIDHYLEIDFRSFMRTVDVLGGVEVCTERPLHDSYSGLDLPAGTSKLDGGRALQYVRARHVDRDSDLGRMKRQQRFLASVIDKATQKGVLMNPVKLDKVGSALARSVRADPGFGSGQMLELARAMRKFTAADSEFASVPVADPSYNVPGIGSTVKWDEAGARRLFNALREDRPLTVHKSQDAKSAGNLRGAHGPRHAARHARSLTEGLPALVEIPPASVRVEIRDGSGRTAPDRAVARALRRTGFATTGAVQQVAGSPTARTAIAYDPRWERSAHTLAQALPGAALVPEAGRGPVMRVTLGTDHRAVREVRLGLPGEVDGTGSTAGVGSGADSAPGTADGTAVRGDKVTCP